ncbi:hypothetical protein B0H16DRAFT_1422818 [Mycena metata]|uniref:Glutaminase GtaA n=1 Tax=Mycena metata TaxID=1033252 RepID=A0AAD7IIH0_9AGAR|nr:hypothetical protein B0H16DRAFT_1422818 [Mycena metata]
MRSQLFCAALYAVQVLADPSWTSTPFNPPSVPLAVRTPYLNTWLPQGTGNALNDEWPTLWQGSVTGWTGFAKVDGQSYSWLGAASIDGVNFTKATQKSFTFTATQSIFVLSAGPVDITVTFLSPVETDFVKLSIPFSYMDVSVASTDGASHSVQIYSDISGEWSSGALEWDLDWTTTATNVVTHQLNLANPAQWEEVSDHIQYGAVYYSALNGKGVTYQTGRDAIVRTQFLNNGTLTNTKDTFFRAISYSWPVFAISKDFGNVGKTPASFLYTIGNVRDPAVKYILTGGATQSRSLYFWSKFSSITQLISFFLNDYSNALKTANALDQKVEADANKISPDYAGIVALSIRQSLGANELTISKNTHGGGWNTSDVLYFMKEISSDGNTNTVDVMFPAFPIFLYLLPELGQYLLEPLLQYQVSGQYPNQWACHDLGPHYPKATGHNDGQDEAMPVEESGNMLIMALSYARATKDNSQIRRYANLLDQWTQFLIEDSLIPANQLSTDDFAGQLANQTNLAIKGITGIRCMAEIWGLLGDKAKQTNYTSIAANYVQQWLNLSASATEPHLTLAYGNDSSWGLAYNLFADVHLKLNLFPKSVYDEQTAWYKTVANQYGVPLDTRHTLTKSDWEIWTSAIVTDTSVRDLFITALKNTLSNGLNNVPFSDLYDTISGENLGFKARPVVGGHLALLIV